MPVIFTTSLGNQEAEILAAWELGAIDYVTKPISPVIVQARGATILTIKRLRDELAEMAVTDALTGLGNRRRLETALHQEAPVGADHGRSVRDHSRHRFLQAIQRHVPLHRRRSLHRHGGGDAELRGAAGGGCGDALWRRGIRPPVAGGNNEEAMAVAVKYREQVQALGIPHGQSEAAPYVTVSVGCATAPCLPGADPMSWVKAAGAQAYLAKASGRTAFRGACSTRGSSRPCSLTGLKIVDRRQ